MIADKHTKTGLWMALLAAVAFGLVLAAPARGEAEEDEAPPPPPMADDQEQVEDDWPPPPPDASRRGRRPRRLDDQQRPGAERAWGRRGQGPGGPMRPGQGPPGMMGRRGPGMLSAEEREQARQVLKDINPELAERLDQWQERSPERVHAILAQYWPRLVKLIRDRKADPEHYELGVKDMRIGTQCEKLRRQFHEARNAGNRDRLEDLHRTIAELVEEHFEVRQRMRELELERLERRLAEARKQLEKRAETRQKLIKQRISDLTGQQREPMW